MKLRVVWWIPVAAVFIAHATGILGNVGTAITGVDDTLEAVIHLKAMFKPLVIPPIKPVVVPKAKKVAKAVPKKAP